MTLQSYLQTLLSQASSESSEEAAAPALAPHVAILSIQRLLPLRHHVEAFLPPPCSGPLANHRRPPYRTIEDRLVYSSNPDQPRSGQSLSRLLQMPSEADTCVKDSTNAHTPTLCMICHGKGENVLACCPSCYLRICKSCADLLRKCGNDLERILGELLRLEAWKGLWPRLNRSYLG